MTAALLLILAAVAYLALIHLGFWRRRGPIRRVAARIHPPREASDLAWEARSLLRRLAGLATDQPRALPLAAAILAGAALLLLALDPILDDPILWGRHVPPGWRAALPGWLKGAWVALMIALVLGHAGWIFLNAPRSLSRHWLLLLPDGAVAAEGADLPRIDPSRPRLSLDGITMPARRIDGVEVPERWAEGATLAQDGAVIAFIANPANPGAGDLRPLAETPRGWWRVEAGPGWSELAAFLRHHHPASGRGVAPGWDG